MKDDDGPVKSKSAVPLTIKWFQPNCQAGCLTYFYGMVTFARGLTLMLLWKSGERIEEETLRHKA
jgi:hypothetical protein